MCFLWFVLLYILTASERLQSARLLILIGVCVSKAAQLLCLCRFNFRHFPNHLSVRFTFGIEIVYINLLYLFGGRQQEGIQWK